MLIQKPVTFDVGGYTQMASHLVTSATIPYGQITPPSLNPQSSATNHLPLTFNWDRYQSKDGKAMDDDDFLQAAIADYTLQVRNVEQPCIARSDVYELACGTYVILANVNRIQAVYRLSDDERSLERITDLAEMQRIIDDYQVVYDEASLCQ